MVERAQLILDELNLEPIIVKAMDPKEGLGWGMKYACKVSEEYRRFWILCFKYQDEAIVPSNVVDNFWHLHILDTQKYMEDCDRYLGYFLHHFPYFGMRGQEDEQNLTNSWEKTKDLYLKVFQESPPKNIWSHANRCPKCGKRVNSEISMEERPSFAKLGLI